MSHVLHGLHRFDSAAYGREVATNDTNVPRIERILCLRHGEATNYANFTNRPRITQIARIDYCLRHG